jgi:hypothetical protein
MRTILLRRFAGNPYIFLGRRPFAEAELRAYIVRQHRAGRPLSEIWADLEANRYRGSTLHWRVLCQPETIAALATDVRDAIRDCRLVQ